MCIDPGITSVGVFAADVAQYGVLVMVRLCTAVNIMACKSGSESFPTKHVHAYICNFFAQYADLFAEASVFVIERQPPQSAGAAVELMFRERYGSKCVYIHPASIHARFGSAGYTYDGRKARSVLAATRFLEEVYHVPGAAAALDVLAGMERKHDCTDACLLFIMHCETAARAAPKPVLPPSPAASLSLAQFLEAYRYKKPD